MRIDAYNAVNQIYQTSQISKAKTAAKTSSVSDKFEISDTAKTYQTARTAVRLLMFEKTRLLILRHVWQQELTTSVQKLLQIRF